MPEHPYSEETPKAWNTGVNKITEIEVPPLLPRLRAWDYGDGEIIFVLDRWPYEYDPEVKEGSPLFNRLLIFSSEVSIPDHDGPFPVLPIRPSVDDPNQGWKLIEEMVEAKKKAAENG